MIKESMMKWRVRRDNRCDSLDQEDIRKSLDVLDSVLAEFDDGIGDSWSHLPSASESWREDNSLRKSCENYGDLDFERGSRCDASSCTSDGICFARSSSTNSFQTFSIDGSSSMPSTFDQHFRKFSPPPVPKRNPATRLSSHENILASYERECQQIAKRRSYAEGFRLPEPKHSEFATTMKNTTKFHDDFLSREAQSPKTTKAQSTKEHEEPLSLSNQLTPRSEIRQSNTRNLSPTRRQSSASGKDDDFKERHWQPYYSQSFKSCSESCSALFGSGFDVPRSASTSNMELTKSRSVAQRRAEFERLTKHGKKKKEDESSFLPDTSEPFASLPVSKSPFLNRKLTDQRSLVNTCNPDTGEVSKSKSSKLPVSATDACVNDENSSITKDIVSVKHTKTEAIKHSEQLVSVADLPSRKINNNRTDDNCHLNDDNSSKTELTSEERIRQLDEKFAKVKYLLKTKQILPLMNGPPQFLPPPPPKPPRKERQSSDAKSAENFCNNTKDLVGDLESEVVSSDRDNSSFDASGFDGSVLKSIPGGLCNGCVTKNDRLESSVTSIMQDIPKIMPSDSYKIPQLGFSYSMEEDMPPGAKEILTSTPKSEASPKSTFNDSISSLGYGSSQSDLDLNISCRDGEKVPVENLKSQTLPTGMKLAPDYYSSLEHNGSLRDGTYHLKVSSTSVIDEDGEEHFRSSSAPPLKDLDEGVCEKGNKKSRSIFGMSRKESKSSKNKHQHDSMRSETSLDDGIILRRIETLGNEYSLPDFNRGSPVQEEKKRRSVWKSILRRK